ncbi:hypothetical protein COCC4DRAFT_126898 [Bipolaris maydis ATCC 48331]|uniref:BRCT domain-containing protein n=2 Tax=Cochliobolus heterostrophus TaxID=5016 RepID=M2URR7_COCH5|nr:uncharacterized protein COCC4DRAFT_126898 [Bipolaris maydis ATCC 48331]EMD90603.1 hypothetical protein COCHEDRAFT_1157605 [Bipolaris maydis C5]ENI09186.1 hypothetical protein COCC4DRAFT_126898 [Bipolaris maydis ATCC 48331]
MGILKNLIIATTGTHVYTSKQIQGWIERNDGHYSPTIHEGVTHLLASEEAYKSKQRTEAVRQALSLGIQILSYDWLDDSLHARKKLPVKSYERGALSKKRHLAKQLKRLGAEADGKKFREGCEEIRKLTGSVPPKLSTTPTPTTPSSTLDDSRTQAKSHWKAEYHYYQDTTGFDYKITLVQNDVSNNITAKYYIGLLESHTKPHTYWGLAQYQPVKTNPTPPLPTTTTTTNATSCTSAHKNPYKTHTEAEKLRLLALISPPPAHPSTSHVTPLCPRNSPFALAWRSFRHAFHDLTLIPWGSRFDAHAPLLQKRSAAQLDVEPYQYVRPRLGMPVGVFPQAGGVFASEGEYVRGTVGIPLVEGGLDEMGAFGAVVLGERRRVEEERRRREGEVQEGKKRKRGARLGDGVDGRGFVAPEFVHLLKGVGVRK